MNYENKSLKQPENRNLHVKVKRFKMTINSPSEVMEQYLISDFEGIGFYIFYYITLNKYVETRKQ